MLEKDFFHTNVDILKRKYLLKGKITVKNIIFMKKSIIFMKNNDFQCWSSITAVGDVQTSGNVS